MSFEDPPLSMATYNGVLELRSRLPNVPETVITYFLSKYGNVDECYEKLKDGYIEDNFDAPLERCLTGPSRPTSTSTSNDVTSNDPSSRPSLHRLPTYGPGIAGGYHTASGGHSSSGGVPPPSLPAMRHPATGLGHDHHGYQSLSPSSSYGSRLSEAESIDLLAAQKKQIEHIHQIRDRDVHELSVLRSYIDKMKQELTKLRIEVSEGPVQSDIGTIQDVISTLQYDIQSVHNKIHVEKTQAEMKGKLDVYTEEGVRWNCEHCKFLNHPLMTRCEFCDRPKR